METIKLTQKSVRICLDMVVIFPEYLAEEFVFGVVYRLDDVFVISREIEETTRLSWRAKFGKDVFGGKRDQIVSRIEPKMAPKMPEDPRRIVLELEIIFGRRGEFISSTVKSQNQFANEIEKVLHVK